MPDIIAIKLGLAEKLHYAKFSTSPHKPSFNGNAGSYTMLRVERPGLRAKHSLYNSLIHHRFRNFHETCDICPLHIINVISSASVLQAL